VKTTPIEFPHTTGAAISADTLSAGAMFEDSAATGIDGNSTDNSAVDSGAAYVFDY
jgi:hypothetical protein